MRWCSFLRQSKTELSRALRARRAISAEPTAERDLSPPFFKYVPAYSAAFYDLWLKFILLSSGRGSAKSFNITEFLIDESFNTLHKDTLFVFGREQQVSIEDSSYAMVKDLLQQAQISDLFKVTNNRITNTLTNVTFAFIGLRSTAGKTAAAQINKIKGKFKVRYIFIDEAQDLSEDVINVLFPTVNRSSKVNVVKKDWHAEDADFKDAETRMLFAMNPQTESDPIVAKLEALQHAAMVREEQSRVAILKLNIFDIPAEFQDKQLLEEAASEEGEIYYDHVWLGLPSHKIGGLPFNQVKEITMQGGNVQILGAFLDPSFKGGDYTALSFVGICSQRGLIVWGKVWRMAWYSVIDEIAKEIKYHKPDRFWYEENALFAVPAEKFAEKGIAAIGYLTLGNKENRIYKVAAFTASRMAIVANLCNAEYIRQVKKYSEEAANDDAPDSLASCLIKCGIIPEKVKF